MKPGELQITREIKFRGKRKDDTIHNGTWVYGHYFAPPLTDENSGLPAESGWFFLSGGERRHCIERDGVVFTVEPETVGQYTGLCDKNGGDIYEGDILRSHTGITGSVDWDDSMLTYRVKWFEVPGSYLHIVGSWCEVIGNIYEHPHLLGGEQK